MTLREQELSESITETQNAPSEQDKVDDLKNGLTEGFTSIIEFANISDERYRESLMERIPLATDTIATCVVDTANILHIDIPKVACYRDAKLEAELIKAANLTHGYTNIPKHSLASVRGEIEIETETDTVQRPENLDDFELTLNISASLDGAVHLDPLQFKRETAQTIGEEMYHLYTLKHYPSTFYRSDAVDNVPVDELDMEAYDEDRGEKAAKLFGKQYADAKYPLPTNN